MSKNFCLLLRITVEKLRGNIVDDELGTFGRIECYIVTDSNFLVELLEGAVELFLLAEGVGAH